MISALLYSLKTFKTRRDKREMDELTKQHTYNKWVKLERRSMNFLMKHLYVIYNILCCALFI